MRFVRFGSLFLFAAVLFAGCGTRYSELSEKDCGHGYFMGRKGACLSWKTGSTVQYVFDSATINNLSTNPQELATLKSEIHAAFSEWQNHVSDLHLQFGGEVGGGVMEGADNVNTIYVVSSGWNRTAASQAYTRILADDNFIQEGDIYLDRQNFQFTATGQGQTIHFRSLLIHEIGHFIGLVHQENNSSVMNESLAYGEQRSHLTSLDLGILDYAYQLIP